MTIKELKSLFTNDTEIIIVSQEDEDMVYVELTNLLLGCPTFPETPLTLVQAIGVNKVVAEVNIPLCVLRAWKKYSDDFYSEKRR